MSWELNLEIDPSAGLPLYIQVARGVSDAILAGRLPPGRRLPGTRRLAGSLGVHRNTVTAAYDELCAEGWVEPRPGSGTYVVHDMPERPPTTDPAVELRGAGPGFDLVLPPAPPLRSLEQGPPGEIVLAGGMPDLRLLPADLLARAYRRGFRRAGRGLLGYGDPQGEPRLRRAVAAMLRSTRGLDVDERAILITRGSQQALFLAARLLLRPGDRVVVEEYGYQPAWETLRAAGAELVPVPVDRDGADVDAIRRVAEEGPLRAAYLTPHHQYPTTAVLSPSRRVALLDLAREHRIAVLEDDYDNEFHYEARPVLPLAASDPGSVVVHLGTLSKVLAPGLRVGWLVAAEPVVRGATRLRVLVDRQGDRAVENAVAELLEDGEVPRHVRRMRKTYRARRDALVAALRDELGDVLRFEVPRGGMNLWAAAPGVDIEEWARRSVERGVRFAPGGGFRFDRGPSRRLRLGFAPHTPDEIRLGVRRLRSALPPDASAPAPGATAHGLG